MSLFSAPAVRPPAEDTMPAEPFGKFIRRRRRELDLTQQQLADRLHKGQSTISELERGVTVELDRDEMPLYATALDLPLGVVMEAAGFAYEATSVTDLPAPEGYRWIEVPLDGGKTIRSVVPVEIDPQKYILLTRAGVKILQDEGDHGRMPNSGKG